MSFAFWILQPKGEGGTPVLNSKLGPDLGMRYPSLECNIRYKQRSSFLLTRVV